MSKVQEWTERYERGEIDYETLMFLLEEGGEA